MASVVVTLSKGWFLSAIIYAGSLFLLSPAKFVYIYINLLSSQSNFPNGIQSSLPTRYHNGISHIFFKNGMLMAIIVYQIFFIIYSF